ncbi:MAG TPA: hypothetical protein VLA48_08320 [Nitrososphaeraceae archaeon]|nr:hypothetical protein [Nitrososphaeraceae archaeon]
MTVSIQFINNFLFSSNQCKKFIVKDGITSSYFEIERNPDFFTKTRLEVISIKKKHPQIGESLSILKNFDHYQYLICTLIPNIADTDPFKKVLQKIRFMIISSITKFIHLLNSNNFQQFEYWNFISKKLLKVVAETVNYFRQGTKFDEILNDIKLDEELFVYLNLDIEKIDKSLDQFYL